MEPAHLSELYDLRRTQSINNPHLARTGLESRAQSQQLVAENQALRMRNNELEMEISRNQTTTEYQERKLARMSTEIDTQLRSESKNNEELRRSVEFLMHEKENLEGENVELATELLKRPSGKALELDMLKARELVEDTVTAYVQTEKECKDDLKMKNLQLETLENSLTLNRQLLQDERNRMEDRLNAKDEEIRSLKEQLFTRERELQEQDSIVFGLNADVNNLRRDYEGLLEQHRTGENARQRQRVVTLDTYSNTYDPLRDSSVHPLKQRMYDGVTASTDPGASYDDKYNQEKKYDTLRRSYETLLQRYDQLSKDESRRNAGSFGHNLDGYGRTSASGIPYSGDDDLRHKCRVMKAKLKVYREHLQRFCHKFNMSWDTFYRSLDLEAELALQNMAAPTSVRDLAHSPTRASQYSPIRASSPTRTAQYPNRSAQYPASRTSRTTSPTRHSNPTYRGRY